jgi:hypothetical protein
VRISRSDTEASDGAAETVRLPAASNGLECLAMRIARAAVLASSLGLLACGGSSSESPWPVEPLDAVHGPKGELLPGKGAADVAPTAAPTEDEGSGESEATAAGEGGSRPGPRAR